MTRSETSNNMRQAVHRACLFIEANCQRDLSVRSVAANVDVSHFHLQKAFRVVIGESMAGYVRRLRLTRAAGYLSDPTCQIHEIAEHSGFATSAGFTKAFRKAYGLSPIAFRASRIQSRSHWTSEASRIEADVELLRTIPLAVSIDSTTATTVAILRAIGDTDEVLTAWNELLNWFKTEPSLSGTPKYFGIHLDDWDAPEHQIRYEAAIQVPDDFSVPAPFAKRTLPAGLRARTFVQGSYAKIDESWKLFYKHWLPASGFQISSSFVYDEYSPDMFSNSLISQLRAKLTGIAAFLNIPVTRSVIPINPVEPCST